MATTKISKEATKKHLSKLFTHEDPIHLHKILGLLSICSFIYRYFVVYPTKGHLGFEGTFFDWLTITLHMGLSTSSLIFHVIAKRIIKRPMIIWQEYRLHAIVFTLRCVSVFAYGVLIQDHLSPDLKYGVLFLLVMCHHLVVDEITRRYGTPRQTTVRVQDKGSSRMKLVTKSYAFYQFLALGSHLIPHARTADLGFNTLIAIQSSAFLMTMYRKAIIYSSTHGIWYTACLFLSGFHIVRTFADITVVFKVACAFFFRVRYRMNKYLIWFVFSAASAPSINAKIREFTWTLLFENNYLNNSLNHMNRYVPSMGNTFDDYLPAMPSIPKLQLYTWNVTVPRNGFVAMGAFLIALVGLSFVAPHIMPDETAKQLRSRDAALRRTRAKLGKGELNKKKDAGASAPAEFAKEIKHQ